MKLNKRWSGEHRGIQFEIQNFKLSDRDGWTFYIYLREPQFKPEDFNKFWLEPHYDDKQRVHYEYSSSVLADLDWHCGITFYEKYCGPDHKIRCVKVGCDYQHYWDDGHSYSETYLEYDVKRCIDSVYEKFSDIRKWCWWCGAWGLDFIEHGSGHLCQPCEAKRVEEVAAKDSLSDKKGGA